MSDFLAQRDSCAGAQDGSPFEEAAFSGFEDLTFFALVGVEADTLSLLADTPLTMGLSPATEALVSPAFAGPFPDALRLVLRLFLPRALEADFDKCTTLRGLSEGMLMTALCAFGSKTVLNSLGFVVAQAILPSSLRL